jgi:hypothetical protein
VPTWLQRCWLDGAGAPCCPAQPHQHPPGPDQLLTQRQALGKQLAPGRWRNGGANLRPPSSWQAARQLHTSSSKQASQPQQQHTSSGKQASQPQQQHTSSGKQASQPQQQPPGASLTSLPNLLSLSRVASAPLICWCITQQQWEAAAGLMALAAVRAQHAVCSTPACHAPPPTHTHCRAPGHAHAPHSAPQAQTRLMCT